MTTTEQIREALEYAKREAQESGKHFSQSEVDRLNAKEYVRIVDRALALLRSMDGQEPNTITAEIDFEAVATSWWNSEEGKKASPGVITLITSEEGRIKVFASFAEFLSRLLPDVGHALAHPSPQTGEPRLTVEDSMEVTEEEHKIICEDAADEATLVYPDYPTSNDIDYCSSWDHLYHTIIKYRTVIHCLTKAASHGYNTPER